MTQFAEMLTGILPGTSQGKVMEHFPVAGTDNLVSSLVCKLSLQGNGVVDETIVMTSLLTIVRSEAYVNEHGLRQIDARMAHWSAKGYSKVLNRTIEYVLADVEQPMSEIVAEQPGADFPAEVTFRAIFDVLVGGETIIRGMDGTAHGNGWMSVPPDGDDYLTVNKDVHYGPAVIEASICVASRSVQG